MDEPNLKDRVAEFQMEVGEAIDRAWHAPQFLVQRGWEFSLKTDHVVNNELFDLAFPLLSSQPVLNSFGVR